MGKRSKGIDASFADEIAERLVKYRHDPYGFCMWAFPWGEVGGDLENYHGPRDWQKELMDEIGEAMRATHDPGTVLRPLLKAVASGHGIGKSAFLSMAIIWAMSTCPGTRIKVTSNTQKQAEKITWPEVSKWWNLSITKNMFNLMGTSLTACDQEFELTWRCDLATWSETNPSAFQGLHNIGKRIVVIFDEAAEIPDVIWEAANGMLTDIDTEIIWLAFANPTKVGTYFHRCFNALRNIWSTKQIDGRLVDGTNKALYTEWAEAYGGEDSDYFRVRVRGEFPRCGDTQLFDSRTVASAVKREPPLEKAEALVLGVDVARFGSDSTVLAFRRGRDAASIPWRSFQKLDTMQVAYRVAEAVREHHVDMVFVDETGMGAGVYDRLVELGIKCQGINFAESPARFGQGMPAVANRRAEMWCYLREWIKGGTIPGEKALIGDLENAQYGFNGRMEIILEKKEDAQKRGIASPDWGDALALTFAAPVFPPTANWMTEKEPDPYDPWSVLYAD